MNFLTDTISKREYALIHCNYFPSEEDIDSIMSIDRMKNPHNEIHKPKLRSRFEIIKKLKLDYINEVIF